jgi:hypothetical protein
MPRVVPWYRDGRPYLPSREWKRTPTACDKCGAPAEFRYTDVLTWECQDLCRKHWQEVIADSELVWRPGLVIPEEGDDWS